MHNPLAGRVARAAVLASAASVTLAMAACSPPSTSSSSGSGTTKAAGATSAADLGGMDKLVAAAKKEGSLNVIALPPDWANYGAVIKAFQSKYGIKITSAQPNASSAEEITAAKNLKGQDRAPDVFDLGWAVASANLPLFAPYKVSTYANIPTALKSADGTWVNDYGGYMSIGYDSTKVPAPTTIADLLKPAYKGKVALNGNPTQANASFYGVIMASLASGGSADDITKGVDFFKNLKKAGNFLPVTPSATTEESGQTPVVFDWDYLNAAESAKNPKWKVVVLAGAIVGSYYVQEVSKDAPHPAAARLWEEFLYSDAGQNLWLNGGARPVLADSMTKAGTIDKAALAKLPPVSGTPVFLTSAQTTKAKSDLAANWAKAVG